MSRRCTDAINPTLVTLLFKSECALCGVKTLRNRGSISELISVGCALDHSFCQSCLNAHASYQLIEEGTGPRCPRYAGTKFAPHFS